jgi:hypothetical protein
MVRPLQLGDADGAALGAAVAAGGVEPLQHGMAEVPVEVPPPVLRVESATRPMRR